MIWRKVGWGEDKSKMLERENTLTLYALTPTMWVMELKGSMGMLQIIRF